jgi:DNA polymerase (family X)
MSANAELAELFVRFAQLMELKGESSFKAIAFTKVARLLEGGSFDVAERHKAGLLKDVEGIGASSLRIIDEFLRTGESSDFAEISRDIPPGLVELLEIPSLGPKTIRLFWQERGVTSLAELESALASGKLVGLKGIGEKKLEAIASGIELRRRSAGRVGIARAVAVAEPMLAALRGLGQVERAEIAGSLRRRKETIGDVDLVCCLRAGVPSSAGAEVTKAFTMFPGVERVLGQGPTKASILTVAGLQVDCRVVPEANFGAALMYFTGSKEHNVRIRGLALDKGLTLNEWGLYGLAEYDKAGKETGLPPELAPVASRTEAEIYAALGLPYIEPELREDRGETTGPQPALITVGDLRGDLHNHTTASDGSHSILEMAEAARALGYEYLGITDHSKSQTIANGLSAERLLGHVEAIRAAAGKVKGITLLAGSEVDILADGSLDYGDEILAQLDIVVASPHVSLRQDTEKATARIIRAMENKYVHIIGHPTGRLIGQREGLPLDFARVIEAAARTGTALEINAAYPRLDLSEVPARQAAARGGLLSINTDSHGTDGFGQRVFGINVARRAGLEARHVLNCMPLANLRQFLARKRG